MFFMGKEKMGLGTEIVEKCRAITFTFIKLCRGIHILVEIADANVSQSTNIFYNLDA